MPDRRRRMGHLLLPRERQSTDENNPFAPPPEGRPDQPWQPRRPENGGGAEGGGRDGGSREDHEGREDSPGEGPGSSGSGSSGSSWGGQWSSRQPGRASGGGFGGRPNGQQGSGGGRSGGPAGLRWDPTDPAQRRARYALLSGMWAFFFALFDFPEIALLLGALALYWAISSLRAKPQSRTPDPAAAQPPASRQPSSGSPARPLITAAVSGLVMASIALMFVAANFTAQLVYRDYYTCVSDALTKDGQLACNELLPEPLRGWIGVKE
ncbi:hypothetical protein QCN29_11830 [Streptomyces sp. HNM0663]|uniref:Integral membrane protein n=1 Tax=Streptomyces chengmaiensis TaxID=3040919 RepID=A0ABT6HL64_9ACTN|nr:hypothetical protein [Streptomyces chengmaiensis]MDH2389471.1 hypothetical protein [Streptomyces chengmaiensis]